MRHYFGIGAEEISKPMNLGALMRTAHAFGASFFFTVNASPKLREAYNSDTSRSFDHIPYYPYESVEALLLPKGCALVGVELTDDAVDLPAFKHPNAAAYVLGRERGSISPALLERCAHVVKIPTKFCLNVGLAGALVMYDRMIAMGGYPARPLMPGGPPPDMSDAPKSKR
ncbi:MAG: RNA methyltransferase [Terricaulis sp.]